ncbi:MAG: signal peptidase II [Nitrospiraceae bacterium]|nr:MAG: signal peptidase II [Nitrospiraceae bacterium]
MNKLFLIGLISSLVAVIDFITKKIIVARLPLYDSINVLPFLNIVHVENRGAAFSMLSQMGNTFFIIISVAAISAIILYLSKLPRGQELYALSLILGGALGNLIDRLRAGKVIDFIDIYVGEWHWPAFNVADSALTVGIVLFLLANLRHGKKAGHSGA